MEAETKEVHLSEDTVRQIASEEKLRLRIRSELEKEKQQPESKVCRFLNSAFGLFLLSSVLVTGLGGLFASSQERARETERKNQSRNVSRTNVPHPKYDGFTASN